MATSQLNSAARNGGITGLAVIALLIVDWQLRVSLYGNAAMGFLQFVVLVALICLFTRRRAISMGDAGMAYGKCLGYIFSMMCFVGIIVGIFQYIMQNYIAADYYREIMENSMEAAMRRSGANTDSQAFEQGMALSQRLLRSPLVIILGSMFTMIIYGTFIGLIASAFLKRNPNIFTNTYGNTEEDEPKA